MQNDPALTGLAFTSRSRLFTYLHQGGPDCLSLWTKYKEVPVSTAAMGVHEVWQVNHSEDHCLLDGSGVTVCKIRDPYGVAMMAS